MADPTHCIVGYAKCGHAELVYIDDEAAFIEPDYRDRNEVTAALVAARSRLHGIVGCLRAGGTLELVSIKEVVAGAEVLQMGCSCADGASAEAERG